MKSINVKALATLLSMVLFVSCLFAQQTTPQEVETKEEKEKKVIIITKKIDKDGKVITEKVVKNANETEVIFLESEEEIDVENTLGRNINVEVEEENGEKRVKINILNNGEMEHMEWNGTGDIPKELIEDLKEKGVIIGGASFGDEENIVVRGNAVQMKRSSSSACLGVRIGSQIEIENINGVETEEVSGFSEEGVQVLGIIEGSGAETAGLLADDIITAINGEEMSTMEDVVAVISSMEPGTTVDVAYLRDGQSNQVTATLGNCGAVGFNDENIEIIKIEKEIIEDDESGTKVIVLRGASKDGEENVIEWSEEDASSWSDLEMEGVRTLDLKRVEVFPNPTDGKVSLQFEAPAASTVISITDASGKEVYREELNDFDGNYNQEIDLAKAAKGILLLNVQQGEKVFSEKLILQ